MGGGGTRAMAGTTGQVRALLSMGLLDEVRVGVGEKNPPPGTALDVSYFLLGNKIPRKNPATN